MPKSNTNLKKATHFQNTNDEFLKASEESNSLSRAGSSEKISKKSGEAVE